MESWYEKISKIRNVTFIFQNFPKTFQTWKFFFLITMNSKKSINSLAIKKLIFMQHLFFLQFFNNFSTLLLLRHGVINFFFLNGTNNQRIRHQWTSTLNCILFNFSKILFYYRLYQKNYLLLL